MDAAIKKPGALASAQAEAPRRPTREEAEAAVRTLIAWAGDDPGREGLRDTPKRVANVYEEFFSGYRSSATEVLGRVFEDLGDHDDIVVLRDIPFSSHCEHHMVPIIGRAHVAYYPGEKVVGLSKLARVIDIYANRLQTQEKLTSQIVTAIDEALKPRGIALMIEAEHLCMTLRGAHKHGASTVTTQFTGVFRDDPAEQQRFLSLTNRGR